jgi:Lrp/AsnC family leucine-responsive transcriptional regulator
MDTIDKNILNFIQKNSRISNVEIARKLDMAPSAILARMRRLEQRKVIERYEAGLNPHAFGFKLMCFILVRTNENVGSTAIGRKLAVIPEVQEVHFLAGEFCYMLKVRVPDTDCLEQLLKKIGSLGEIRDTRTTLVLRTIKETLCLPIIDEKKAE